MNKKGFSLVEIMLAVVILCLGIVSLYYLFSQGSVELSKASYVTLATTIAKGEIDSYKSAEYCEIKNEESEWTMLKEGDKVFELFDIPEDYWDRFEKKVKIEDAIQDRLKKITVSVRWFEIVKNKKKYRQFNYPTFIANTRVYIYFN